MQQQQLNGRRALVIGAGSALGREIAVALAGAGADVAVASATIDGEEVMAARRTRRSVEALGRRSAEYAFDTTLGQNVQVSTRQVSKEMGGLDILVNAQDYPLSKPAERTSDAEWTRTVALNLGGVFFACRAAVREMAAGGGAILNVIPALPPEVMSTAAVYAAARFGILGLTRALALEYAGRHIHVNALAVGSSAPRPRGDVASGEAAGLPAASAADLGAPGELGALAVYLVHERPERLSGLCLSIGAGTSSP